MFCQHRYGSRDIDPFTSRWDYEYVSNRLILSSWRVRFKEWQKQTSIFRGKRNILMSPNQCRLYEILLLVAKYAIAGSHDEAWADTIFRECDQRKLLKSAVGSFSHKICGIKELGRWLISFHFKETASTRCQLTSRWEVWTKMERCLLAKICLNTIKTRSDTGNKERKIANKYLRHISFGWI